MELTATAAFDLLLIMILQTAPATGLKLNVGSRWDVNGTLTGPLVVQENELVIYCEVTSDTPSQSGSETTVSLGHTFVSWGFVPSITIQNSTWSRTFTFGADSWNVDLGHWKINLPSREFSPSESVNTGEWYGIVEMDVSTGLLREVVSIVDPHREPIQILREFPLSEPSTVRYAAGNMTRLVSSQSPCSPDVTALALISHTQSQGMIVGLSFEGLKRGSVQWVDLAAVLCQNTTNQGCDVERLIDLQLTSEYLILLTPNGITSIHLEGERLNQEHITHHDIHQFAESTPLEDCRLAYTPTCNAESLLDEVIFLVKHATHPDQIPQVLALSPHPFTSWRSLNLTGAVPILAVHLAHSTRFLILASKEDRYDVGMYRKDQLFSSQATPTKPFFPTTSLSSAFRPRGACVDTVGYHVFLYGNQMWRSYDSVVFHHLVTLPAGEYVTTCASSTNHPTTLFLTDAGNIYISKTGVPSRIIRASESIDLHRPSILFINHIGDVLVGAVHIDIDSDEEEEGEVQTVIRSIDITKSIQESSHPVDSAITVEHIAATRFMLQEGGNHSNQEAGYGISGVARSAVLSETSVGQELVWSGMHLLITGLRAIGGRTRVAMATSQEASLHANMKSPLIARNVTNLLLQEGPCHHVLTPHPSVAKQPTRYMDIGDVFVFQISASYVGPMRHPTRRELLSFSVTNPSLLDVQVARSYDRYGMETATFTVRHRLRNKGISSIVVSITSASLLCQRASFTLTVHCTCPPTKRLHFVYDPLVTAEEFLHGSPKNTKNQSLLTILAVNYRPPSRLGISIPLTKNIYNADPSQPRLNDHYDASKTSGFYKQCAGKASKQQCGCTDEMRLSSLELFTDCRERVYRNTYTENVYPHLVIRERGKEDRRLAAPYILTVTELNDREDFVIQAAEVEYLSEIERIVGISGSRLYSPDRMEIIFLATQLYHFRLAVIDGFSYCVLEDEFQMYVDRAPLPGLSQMIIFATVSVLMGGGVFIIYLNYFRKTEVHRTRSMMALYEQSIK